MKKRDLFAEMMQGVEEMAAHREGKITLRQRSMGSVSLIPAMAAPTALHRAMRAGKAEAGRSTHSR
jgi:hypothetical protein